MTTGVPRLRTKHSKPVIGIAGGIGSGKSSVARIFESLGAAVIDSDRLTHEQLLQPDVIATLRSWWGDAVCRPDGSVDRAAVAAIVFADERQLARLQELIYPRIEQRRRELTERFQVDPAVRAIVLDAPKLFEVGLDTECDTVVFVESDRATRLQRLAAAKGWTDAELARREKLMNPLDSKKAMSDHIVVNHSSLADLRSEIGRILAAALAS